MPVGEVTLISVSQPPITSIPVNSKPLSRKIGPIAARGIDNLDSGCKRLVGMANEKGGHDNVTPSKAERWVAILPSTKSRLLVNRSIGCPTRPCHPGPAGTLAATVEQAVTRAMASFAQEMRRTNAAVEEVRPPGPETPAPVVASLERPEDTRLSETVERIEAVVGAGTASVLAISSQLGAIADGVQAFRGDFSALSSDLAAVIESGQVKSAELIQHGVAELATRVHKTESEINFAAGVAVEQVATGSEQTLAKLSAVIERLAQPIDRLTRSLDLVEGKIATHLSAFDGVTRSLKDTDQAITASARALQGATMPLSKVASDIAQAMTAMVNGVDVASRALLEGQRLEQQLADGLKSTFRDLNEIWERHEARFMSVDESVARVLVSIIEHAEAHGEALKNHVVAIDTHLYHTVNSLAANIDSLQEITNDLTTVATGIERFAAVMAQKTIEHQG
ncbi:hypothetical protein WCLP8_1850014 [uncultured Gammaproteobacteria bacterium]